MLINISAALGAWFILSIPTGLVVGRLLRGQTVALEIPERP